MTAPLRQQSVALFLFGMSFGLIEAAVVVYLRTLAAPHRAAAGLPPDELFPLLSPARAPVDPALYLVLRTELLRELATLLLNWSIALAVVRGRTARFAAFLIAFGWWDIFYYVWLRLLIHWPTSLLTPDLLFLLPVPWWGPVLSPLLAAAAMVAGGSLYLWRPFDLSGEHWAGIVAGGATMVVAFCWDYRLLLDGGIPTSFAWHIYLVGWLLAVVSAGHACWGRRNILVKK